MLHVHDNYLMMFHGWQVLRQDIRGVRQGRGRTTELLEKEGEGGKDGAGASYRSTHTLDSVISSNKDNSSHSHNIVSSDSHSNRGSSFHSRSRTDRADDDCMVTDNNGCCISICDDNESESATSYRSRLNETAVLNSCSAAADDNNNSCNRKSLKTIA